MATYPLVEALLRRSQAGVTQINQRGSAIGSALQPFAARVGSYYGPIQQQESAIGSSLNSSLAATGAQIGSQIGGSLAANQAPAQAVSQYGGGAATMGAQAGAAVGGLSSADLTRLKGEATAEQIYAAALPRLAALAADQERRAFLEDAQQELAELAARQAEVNQENARYERDFQRQQQQDQQRNRRQAQQDRIERSRYRTNLRMKQKDIRYDRQQDKQAARAAAARDRMAQQALAYEMGQDYVDNQQEQQRINISAGNLALATRRQGESERQFAARERRYQQQFQARMRAAREKGGQPSSSLSAKYGYIVDSRGRPILTKNGKRIPVRTDKKTKDNDNVPPSQR
jgi:hypothetical protein